MNRNVSRWVAVLALGTFVVVLDTTFMNVSITALADDLRTTVDGIQAAAAINALSMAVFVLLGGKLGDVLGMKRTYLIGVVLTILGSLVASIANNLAVFVLGWCFIQGIGSAFMMPNIQSIIRTNAEGKARAGAYGLLGGVAAAGAAIGPIIGGFLTAYLSWRWAFRIEIITLVVVLLLSGTIPKDPAKEKRPAVDWVGVLLQGVAMSLIVLGITLSDTYGLIVAAKSLYLGPINLTPFGISPMVTMVGAGILFLFLFKQWEERRESRGQEVLLDLDLFKNRAFTTSLVVRSVQIMVTVGILFTVPLFLQVTFGLDAFETGLIILPLSLTLIVMVPLSVRLAGKFPPRHVVRTGWGLGVGGSVLLMILMQVSPEPAYMIPGLILFAAGMAMITALMANIVMSSVKDKEAPEASGVMATFEQVGNSLGVAILSTILALALTQGVIQHVTDSQVLPADLQMEIVNLVEAEGVEIVDNIEVYQAAQADQYPEEISREIVTLYDTVRTNAFETTMLVTALICATGFFLSKNLTRQSLEELTTGNG